MDEYIPGVCNIGPAEIRRRRQSGILGLVLSVGLLVFLLVIQADPVWRLLVALPVMSAATGFLQAYFHFCAGFGFKGVYNLAKPAGQTETVQQKEFRQKDRQKALQISAYSFAIGALVGIIAYSLPI